MQAVATLKSVYPLPVLLAVSRLARSTFFYHQAHRDKPDKYEHVKECITRIMHECGYRYGYRRVTLMLVRCGIHLDKKTVLSIMRSMGLTAKKPRKRGYNSYRGTIHKIAPNLLNRRFQVKHLNRVWVSDITEFRVGQHKLYLSPVMDLCNHEIIAYTLSTHPDTTMTSKSVSKAFKTQQPEHGLLVHTDQGHQYQHVSWRKQLVEHSAIQSMSRKGNCWDNSVMENFFSHLKKEMYHKHTFASITQLGQRIAQYIHWYNNERIQERLNGMSPVEYRQHIRYT